MPRRLHFPSTALLLPFRSLGLLRALLLRALNAVIVPATTRVHDEPRAVEQGGRQLVGTLPRA